MQDLILTINEKEFIANFDKKDNSIINLNGKPFQIDLLKRYSHGIFSFSVNQKLMQVALEFDDQGNLVIMYEGLAYYIDVSNETKKLLSQFIKQAGAIGGADSVIKSPMPGMVVKILVEEGQRVMKGDKVVIVEAMKMENALAAPIDGRIKKIHSSEGAAVNKDAPLIEIEI